MSVPKPTTPASHRRLSCTNLNHDRRAPSRLARERPATEICACNTAFSRLHHFAAISMSDTLPGSSNPSNGKPNDSDAPTQLWQSPLRHLSQFPLRRAARRRERLEALLKGQEITSTGALSSTNLTQTANRDVSPPPPAYHPSAEEMPPPPSIPTGTYTSIRPVSGPRLAVFVALGVAVGGLAALQLNRVLTPHEHERSERRTVESAQAAAAALVTPSTPQAAPPLTQPSMPEPNAEACAPGEFATADVPPLPVDVVASRPTARATKASSGLPASDERLAQPASESPPTASVNREPSSPGSCERYPSVHIPTQLHPRINPLMTSSQVFTERGTPKSNGPPPNR